MGTLATIWLGFKIVLAVAVCFGIAVGLWLAVSRVGVRTAIDNFKEKRK